MLSANRIRPEVSTASSRRTRDVWSTTTRTLGKVLRNSLLSTAIAWIFAFCCSVGNVFSGRGADAQSTQEFLVAKMLWFHYFFCAATVSIFLSLLLTEQPAGLVPTTRSPLAHWSRRMAWLTSPYFFVVCKLLSVVLESAKTAKASVYFTHICFYVFVGCTDVQARFLYRSETARGQVRTRQQLMRHQRRLSERPDRKPLPPERRRFVRVLLEDLPLVASAVFATAYVHTVSAIKIATQWDLAPFALCSISLKLLLQEMAKGLLTRKRRTPNMRSMAITVAAPTILVDTQLRTVLLCQDNASMTVVVSLLLAIAEVCVRVVKTAYVQWHVHRLDAQRHSPFAISLAAKSATKIAHVHVAPVRTTSSLRLRVHRLLSLHAAEVYADMYAEYIAMGCSYGILFFFGAHAKYQLGNGETPAASRWTNASITGLQLALEVVVDLVACALEIRRGIDLERFNQDDAFLAVFMVAVALVNVHTRLNGYMSTSTS
ncbi:hypothetical protein PHYPSEUDO_002686 [Phytophthora pseudosyringae]|uniref:Transmembrane protein n=1 Tax=Phytophthora pseudosyringae TaxID=221518 RepID=A0A8T1WIU8_9STRA|nr:hypothetical protein PHYPSEUDO_002686 [Phytophthora pseudosyringae]